jgi:hypothetical protein
MIIQLSEIISSVLFQSIINFETLNYLEVCQDPLMREMAQRKPCTYTKQKKTRM